MVKNKKSKKFASSCKSCVCLRLVRLVPASFFWFPANSYCSILETDKTGAWLFISLALLNFGIRKARGTEKPTKSHIHLPEKISVVSRRWPRTEMIRDGWIIGKTWENTVWTEFSHKFPSKDPASWSAKSVSSHFWFHWSCLWLTSFSFASKGEHSNGGFVSTQGENEGVPEPKTKTFATSPGWKTKWQRPSRTPGAMCAPTAKLVTSTTIAFQWLHVRPVNRGRPTWFYLGWTDSLVQFSLCLGE